MDEAWLWDGDAKWQFITSLPTDWDTFKIRLYKNALSKSFLVILLTSLLKTNKEEALPWYIGKNEKMPNFTLKYSGFHCFWHQERLCHIFVLLDEKRWVRWHHHFRGWVRQWSCRWRGTKIDSCGSITYTAYSLTSASTPKYRWT